jgi:PAS domain S-box-containing protein
LQNAGDSSNRDTVIKVATELDERDTEEERRSATTERTREPRLSSEPAPAPSDPPREGQRAGALDWPAWLRYGIGLAAGFAAVLLTTLLPDVFRGIPFMPAFLAVFVSGAYGGAGASVVTTLIAGLLTHFAVYPAEDSGASAHLRLLLFLTVAGLISLLQAKLWAARRGEASFRLETERSRRNIDRAEEQVRELLETVTDAFCTLDRSYRFTYLNARAERVIGRAREEVLGKDVREEYPLEPGQVEVIQRAMEERVPGQFEFFFRPTSRWISATVYPRPDGVSILFRDVTKGKRTEEDLQRLAAIVESSEDAIVAKDLNGFITSWNPGAQRLFGYTAAEVIGKPISIIMPDDHKADMTAILDRIRRGERIEHFETVRVGKDGRPLIVFLSVSPIRDASGRIVGASKIARNISERREAERKILEAERQLQLALKAARMGTWNWNLTTGQVELSQGLQQILGIPAGLFDGKPESFLAAAHPDDRAAVDSALRAAADEGSTCEIEFRVLLPGGGMRWVVISGQVFPGSTGAPTRMIGIGRDITERKEAEVERERLYAEAQEAVETRDAFLSVAGHEFRTPLGALSLTIHNLARSLGPVSERARKSLEGAQRQIERLTKLTEDLLQVGRINAGRLTLEPERMDLSEVVREVVDRLAENAKRAGCPIEVRADEPVVGTWDRSRLDQVITNLLTNALKFGSGRPVEVALACNNGTALLTVRDQGIGVSAENQARIFQRFERAVSGKSYQGIGLGLWITRQIVEAHGGSIRVESESGKGATFRVQLPGVGEGQNDAGFGRG